MHDNEGPANGNKRNPFKAALEKTCFIFVLNGMPTFLKIFYTSRCECSHLIYQGLWIEINRGTYYDLKSAIACRAGVFLASKRSVLLFQMCGSHLGFSKQRKVGERKKFLPRGWIGDTRGQNAFLYLPLPAHFYQIKHDGSTNYR